MEERVVSLVTQGGDVAFVIVLVIGLAFWMVLKFREFEKRMETIERRLDDGDSRFHDKDKTIATMAQKSRSNMTLNKYRDARISR